MGAAEARAEARAEATAVATVEPKAAATAAVGRAVVVWAVAPVAEVAEVAKAEKVAAAMARVEMVAAETEAESKDVARTCRSCGRRRTGCTRSRGLRHSRRSRTKSRTCSR